MQRVPEREISSWISGLGNLAELRTEDVGRVIACWAARLGLITDEERIANYRKHVARRYEYVDSVGIAQTATILSMPLDAVFTPLSAVPEEALETTRAAERELIEELRRAEHRQERAEIERRLSQVGGRGFQRPAMGRPAAMAQVFERQRKVVVLGDPGSGKTTLMKWLTRACAQGPEAMEERLGWHEDLVPVVVAIAAYGVALGEDSTLPLREHIRRDLERQEGVGFGDLLLKRMEKGECLVLLDGLDEIPDPQCRLAAGQRVGDLMAQYPHNRYVATSRIIGYSICRVRGDISHYVLRGFTDDEIKLFATKWCEAYDRASHREAPDLARARREGEELTAAIFHESHPQLAEFARNPLLLTILALIKRQGVALPQRRAELYEVALKTLTESWVRARSIAGPISGVELDTGQSVRVWQRVAYWMHHEKPTGTAHRTELIRELREALVGEEGLGEREAEETAQSFLTLAAERTGLLQAQGENVFGFLHQTFEEYLAARQVARPPQSAFERVAAHLHDPHWREVVLLAAGYMGAVLGQPECAGEFIESMGKAGSSYEDILHRDLLLAAECLADRTPADRRCHQRVLAELCDVLSSEAASLSERIDCAGALARLRGLQPSRETTEKLLALAGRWYDSAGQRAAVALLASVDSSQTNDALRQVLAAADTLVVAEAVAALLRRGKADDEVLTGLVTSLTLWGLPYEASDEAEIIRRGIAGGACGEEVISLLVTRTYDERPHVRGSTAEALGKLGLRSAVVVGALLALLEDGDTSVRASAARALGMLGETDVEVLKGLEGRLSDDDIAVRMSAAEALDRLGAKNGLVLDAVLNWLETETEEEGVRACALETLAKVSTDRGRLLTVLRPRLRDRHGLVRSVAAQALGSLGDRDRATIAGLVALLADEDYLARASAAEALAELGVVSRNSSVCPDVTGRLFGDESGAVQLGRSGCSTGEGIVVVGV